MKGDQWLIKCLQCINFSSLIDFYQVHRIMYLANITVIVCHKLLQVVQSAVCVSLPHKNCQKTCS